MATGPIFICFAGIDGSGKSSQAQSLQKYLQASGINTIYTWSRWEPYLLKPFIMAFKGSPVSKATALSNTSNLLTKKRRFLSNPVVLRLWLNLALFDYYWQVRRRVIKHIEGSNVVICDRYLFDFVVDQAVNISTGTKGMEHVLRFTLTSLFPLPDLLFILDVEPETGFRRKQDGTSVEYLSQRREFYNYFEKLPYANVFDANNPFEMVARQITERTMTFLKERGVING